MDLGIGAYRDNNAKPWVLPVVKKVGGECIQHPVNKTCGVDMLTRPTTASARTQTSTTSICQSPVLLSSLLPRRSSFLAPTPQPSPTSASSHYRLSLALALSTSVVSSFPNSTTHPPPKPRLSTPARPHGPTTTRSLPTSACRSSHTRTSAKRQRVLTSMACFQLSSLLQRVASSSFTLALTTQLVSTPHKINGRRLLLS